MLQVRLKDQGRARNVDVCVYGGRAKLNGHRVFGASSRPDRQAVIGYKNSVPPPESGSSRIGQSDWKLMNAFFVSRV